MFLKKIFNKTESEIKENIVQENQKEKIFHNNGVENEVENGIDNSLNNEIPSSPKKRRGRPKGSINPDSKYQQMLRRKQAKKERENMLD